MRLYEDYFADAEALDDEKIAEFRKYHQETRSFWKYYYMDGPEEAGAYLQEYQY